MYNYNPYVQNNYNGYNGWYQNNTAPVGQLNGEYVQPKEAEEPRNTDDAVSEKSDHLKKEKLRKCNKLYNQNEIYLFQFLIDNVVIKNENPLLEVKDMSAPLTALIKFNDFPCFEVRFGETVALDGYSNQQIVTGISCLFSTTALQLVRSLMKTPVAVNIFRIINKRYETDPSSKVGHVLIYMDEDFSATVLRNTEEATRLPIKAAVKKLCQLHNTFSEPTGDITVYMSLSCFGKVAFTQVWLSSTTKDQYKYISVTNTEEDAKKVSNRIKEEECHLLPLIANDENMLGLNKHDVSDEDNYLYKRKTYEWEKYAKECGCHDRTDKDFQKGTCSQLGKEYVPRLSQPETTLKSAKHRPTVRSTCPENCVPNTQRLASDALQLHAIQPKDVHRRDSGPSAFAARKPTCPFDKHVCVCDGKCECKLPERCEPLLKKYIIPDRPAANQPDENHICPFDKDICKCSGKCRCKIPSENVKHFVNRKQPTLSTAPYSHSENIKCASHNSLMPKPQWSKPPFVTDTAELNFKFRQKDCANMKSSQPWSDACPPCPFKIGCPFC